jgi:hypothetical protein
VLINLTSAEVFAELEENSLKTAISQDGVNQNYVEVEYWNGTEQQAFLWCKMNLNSAVNETFYFYFDSAKDDNTDYVGLPNSVAASNVWDNNYVLVDHMQDYGDTAHTVDSTSNDNNGAKLAANQPLEAAGKIGAGQQGDVANDRILYADSASLQPTRITYSVWAKLTTASAANPHILRKNQNFLILGGAAAPYTVWFRAGTTGGVNNKLSGNVIALGVMYKLDATFDGSELNVYVNGAVQGAPVAQVGSLLPYAATDYLVFTDGSGNYYDFLLDELRISSSARSAAWVKTSYYGESDLLLTVGSVEARPPLNIVVGAGGLNLGYGNGTFVQLPMGTYTGLNRTDNVWYVNGEVYPFVDTEMQDLTAIAFFSALFSIAAIGLVMVWKKKER